MALGITKLSNVSIESAESVATNSLEWASDTGGTALNAGAGERFMDVNLQISVTFNASATGNAELHIRRSADDGTTKTTDGTLARVIACSAGNTVVITHPVYDFDFLDVGIKNLDTTYTLTWTGIYEGRKITGMA